MSLEPPRRRCLFTERRSDFADRFDSICTCARFDARSHMATKPRESERKFCLLPMNEKMNEQSNGGAASKLYECSNFDELLFRLWGARSAQLVTVTS